MTTPIEKPVHLITITIDSIEYQIKKEKLTGQELRSVPNPDVPENRDLWLEVKGPKDDELIEISKTYVIKKDSIYYTAPKTINPGNS